MSLKQDNLISTSVQYKVGQRLVKVGSSFLPVGFGGNFEPGKGGEDTSTFETIALSIIGNENFIPDAPGSDDPSNVPDISAPEVLEGCVFAANMQTASATYNGETVTLGGITLADAPGYTDGTKAMTASRLNLGVDWKEHFQNNEIGFAFSFYYPDEKKKISLLHIDDLGGSSTGAAHVITSYGTLGDFTIYALDVLFGKFFSKILVTTGWNHVLLTLNNGTASCYINGKLWETVYKDEEGLGVWYSLSDYVSGIMYTGTNYDSFFIKDVYIYNRVLSEDEITTLYEKAKLPKGA